MRTEHASQLEVTSRDEVPSDVSQAVFERLVSTEAADAKRAGKAARAGAEVMAEYRQGVRDLLGEKKYREFRARAADEKRAWTERMIREVPELSPDMLDGLRKQRREARVALLDKMGIRAADVAKLAERARQRLTRQLPEPTMVDGKPARLVLPADVPAAIRKGKTNPWTQVKPPYEGQGWNYTGWTAGFSFTPTLHLDKAAGLVGTGNSLTDSDASDIDAAAVEYNARIGFWFKMPAAGLVEVWIEAQSAASHHHLSLDDEWGVSDSWVHQYDYLTLQTVGAAPDELKLSQMSYFYEKHHTDGNWDKHYLTDGATYWTHLFSGVSYPAGTWVWVRVGTQTYHSCGSNDVEVYSTVDFRWFIKSVWIEST